MFYPVQVFDGSDRVIKKSYHDSILPYCNHASDMLVTIVRAGVSTNPCWPCLGQSDERAPRVAVVRSGFWQFRQFKDKSSYKMFLLSSFCGCSCLSTDIMNIQVAFCKVKSSPCLEKHEMGWYWNNMAISSKYVAALKIWRCHIQLQDARILGQLHGLIGLGNVCPQILAKADDVQIHARLVFWARSSAAMISGLNKSW